MKKIILISLLIVGLFLVGCEERLDPDGNPVEEDGGLAGQAITYQGQNIAGPITAEMLEDGITFEGITYGVSFHEDVGEVNFNDFFANLGYLENGKSKLTYIWKSSPNEIFKVPDEGEPAYDGSEENPYPYSNWGQWMEKVQPGVKFNIAMGEAVEIKYLSDQEEEEQQQDAGEADLSVVFYDVSPKPIVLGEFITANIKIKNEGNLDINEEFQIEIYSCQPDAINCHIPAGETVDSISVGEVKEYNLQFEISANDVINDNVMIGFFVDGDGQIEESNEGNNDYKMVVSVEGKQDAGADQQDEEEEQEQQDAGADQQDDGGCPTDPSGECAHATGSNTVASGDVSTAMGNFTLASGDVSTAMGADTVASGDHSTAMGYSTVASGKSSTAMGSDTIASGYRSTAMGVETVASGKSSTAMGSDTIASGSNSTAMGSSTEASGYSSTAMGLYSVADKDNTFAVGLTSTWENKCETEAEGEFRACTSDMVIEIGDKEVSMDELITVVCGIEGVEASFCN